MIEGSVYDLRGVAYRYDHSSQDLANPTLKNVSLHILQGEFVAIMGTSGSGKTTLLNLLGLLTAPTQGELHFLGENTNRLDNDQRALLRGSHIGFVFQNLSLLNHITVIENVLLPLLFSPHHHLSKNDGVFENAISLLNQTGMPKDSHGKMPLHLSGGQQQRVAICRALLQNPRVILADEPTAALDSKTSNEVMAIFKKLNRLGHTIVLITHDPKIASQSNRIIHISNGTIVGENILPFKPIPLLSENSPNKVPPSEDQKTFHSISKKSLSQDGKFKIPLGLLLAWRSLIFRPLRSLIMGLGLCVGVASISLVFGLGLILEKITEDFFHSKEFSNIHMWAATPTSGRESWVLNRVTWPQLSAFIRPLGNMYSHLTLECPLRINGKTLPKTTIKGFHQPQFSNWDGGYFLGTSPSAVDFTNKIPVTVIQKEAIDTLFAKNDGARAQPQFPLGQFIFIEGCGLNKRFQIVGVFNPRTSAMNSWHYRAPVYIPSHFVDRTLPLEKSWNYFQIEPKDSSKSMEIAQSLKNYISFLSNQKVNYEFWVPTEFISKVAFIADVLKVVITSIGVLCLVIGGLSLINILNTSLKERLYEVGLMAALGATAKNISAQFFTESVLVCVFSSVIGIVLSWLMTNGFYLGTLLYLQKPLVEFRPIPNFYGTFLGLGLGLFAGLVCGYIPAQKAASLDPTQCLRLQ